jgi:hypothetical protein
MTQRNAKVVATLPFVISGTHCLIGESMGTAHAPFCLRASNPVVGLVTKLIYGVGRVMITPINTYAPSLLKSLGFAGFSANGHRLQSLPCSFLSASLTARESPQNHLARRAWLIELESSDRFRERPLHIALAMSLSGVGLLWLALAPDSSSKWVLYGGYLLAAGTMATGQSINAAWMSGYLEDRTVRGSLRLRALERVA